MAVKKVTLKNEETRWQVDYRDAMGKRLRKRFYRKKEADSFWLSVRGRASVSEKPEVDGRSITFGGLCGPYIERLKVLGRAPKTVAFQIALITPTLKPKFGLVRLNRLTTKMLLDHRASRISDGKSVRTANADIQQMKTMLSFAVEQGLVKENVADGIKPIRDTVKKKEALTVSQISSILEAARGTHLHILVLTALHTGMRKGELFDLRWKDVDFDEGVLHVRTTKNYTFRMVNITGELRPHLHEHRQFTEDLCLTHDHVFHFRGKPLSTNVDSGLKRLASLAGVPKFGLHLLRHTFASHLAMEGVPPQIIQKIMGHKDPRSTQVYMHLSPDSYRSASFSLPYAEQGGGEKGPR